MARPISATIDRAALRHNLALARKCAGEARILAVIKANGYGHGALRVAQALSEADGYAVLELDQALALRQAGISKPIVLLEGFFAAEELSAIARHRLTTVVHQQAQLDVLETKAEAARIDVFLKLNTGMNRLGFSAADLPAALARLRRLQQSGKVGEITLMTHFAAADEAEGIATQLALFEAYSAGLDLPRSLANSAALLRYPESVSGWVRPGIMLYGCSPFADVSAQALGLRPAMTLRAAIIAVQELQSGDRVGYAGTFRAATPMRIGIVSCGYADGYPRHAPSGTPVLVNGARSRLVGRVSMDMICVDLSSLPTARVGTPVTLWGVGLSADEVARAAGTVSYELLCKLTARVPITEV